MSVSTLRNFAIFAFLFFLLGILFYIKGLIHFTLLFWLFSIILFIYLSVLLGQRALSGDFLDEVDLSGIKKEWIKIPYRIKKDFRELSKEEKNLKENFRPLEKGEDFLWCAVYKKEKTNSNEAFDEKKPYIIVTHGANGFIEQLEFLIIPLVRAGYNVIGFNQAGHGRKPHHSCGNGRRYPNVMVNIHDVVSFVLQLGDLLWEISDSNKDTNSKEINGKQIPVIGFIGHSTGGLMAMTQAYLNPYIKMTIALSGIHDFMGIVKKKQKIGTSEWWFKLGLKISGLELNYSEKENKMISPKYCLQCSAENENKLFMIHTKDDILPFSDALKNSKLACLPDSNHYWLEKGGHSFRSQETLIVAQILDWLRKINSS